MTKHPVVVIVVKGEHIVVKTTALPIVIMLSTHRMLVYNAVSKLQEDDNKEAKDFDIVDNNPERELK